MIRAAPSVRAGPAHEYICLWGRGSGAGWL